MRLQHRCFPVNIAKFLSLTVFNSFFDRTTPMAAFANPLSATNRPEATDRLFYLIFVNIFNHIVGMCRELVLRNVLSDWSKPSP